MNKLLFVAIILLPILSCSKDDVTKDKNGIVISMKANWVTSITDDDSLSNNFMFKHSISNDNSVVIRARKQQQNILKCLNTDDGTVKWDWNEFSINPLGISYPHKYNNNLIWQEDYYNYCVDLSTGKTVWKNTSVENYEYRSLGVNNMFTVGHLANRNKPTEKGGNIVVMDSKTGKPIFSFKPKYDATGDVPSNECGWGYWGFPIPFSRDGKEYILIKFNDAPIACKTSYVEWLGLYNYTDKTWVYERQRLKSNDNAFTTPTPSVIVGDKVYNNPTNSITCHDLMTGNKLWETQTNGSTGSRILVENGYVYLNSGSGNMMAIDANSGTIKWSVASPGGLTTPTYLNGFIYFIGASDGKLNAIDAVTGEYIWKIESPDKSKNKWATFLGPCTVVPGVGLVKSKIIVTTGLNAYCYEAIK